MKTITEDYVSFETAKLLKDKGFPQEYDIYHSMVYNEEDYENEYEVQRMVLETRLVKAGTLSSYPIGVPEPKCYCPTLQMVMKWLREVHNTFIDIYLPSHSEHEDTIYHGTYSFDIFNLNKKVYVYCTWGEIEFNSYEQAIEAALKHYLKNLI